MKQTGTLFWRKSPFIKLLLAFASGTWLQWQWQPPPLIWVIFFVTGTCVLIGSFFISLFNLYRYRFITGLSILFIFLAAGGLLTRLKDIRYLPDKTGIPPLQADCLLVTLNENPVVKTNSFKTEAIINTGFREGKQIQIQGKIILYFRKDSPDFAKNIPLAYGHCLLIKNKLQRIQASGNPGGFDYARYQLFRGISQQAFLRSGDFILLPDKKIKPLQQWLISSQEKLVQLLRKYITGEQEKGLAEALLIGYKNDLDKELVQSYSNTGVVHIIAISGLHLGIIYWLLELLFQPLLKKKKSKWLRPILIITGLWTFSLLAGAQPSVLRSALMFSMIVIGESLGRKNTAFNSLACSALVLLLINPFWLWDPGFQLSYAAVASILIFMRPVYNLFYFPNKLIDFIWKMNAVTLAAQILTLPLSIYHFHQFPPLFFLSNLLAVPLSSIILLAAILLCVIAWLPEPAHLLGQLISGMIRLMNQAVSSIEQLPGAVWDGLYINQLQVILLLISIAAISYWLMEKRKKGCLTGIATILCFLLIRTDSFIQCEKNNSIIVYNVPGKTAIDFIAGRKLFYSGNANGAADAFIQQFHLRPSRILQRAKPVTVLPGLLQKQNQFSFLDKRILLLSPGYQYREASNRQKIDLLIISGNPRLYMTQLIKALDIRQVVCDGVAPVWKRNYWQKDCDSLKIPFHDVTIKGAFVMNLN
ncbi:MAG TPA: ComEC/Rec2 family competence protein [Chitinophagaceae bacterium]|nr:ComEC/Rec2 family competence protein [Chitinophagaceae bacterium]